MIPFADSDVHHNTFPIVNLVLIILNVLVFLYEIGIGGLGTLFGGNSRDLQIFFLTWGFIPAELSQGQAFTQLSSGFGELGPSIETPVPTWATIGSSMFMHGGLMHLVGNMAFLWVFGDNIEDGMGHLKYLFFYLGVGVAATLTHFAFDPGSQVPLVGASGAIFGVLGAYFLTYPHNRVKAVIIFYIITVVNVSAMILLGVFFLWNVLQSVLSIGVSDSVSVAFGAHVGGFVAGLVVIGAYKLLKGQPLWPPKGGGPPFGGRGGQGGDGRAPQYWRGRRIN